MKVELTGAFFTCFSSDVYCFYLGLIIGFNVSFVFFDGFLDVSCDGLSVSLFFKVLLLMHFCVVMTRMHARH